ncbi:cell division protein FtsQ [Legionella beliardensis]|uniref:Cell division protein FtsQ n=1 Tax=Legionella beliardensis TaxID=91822 RepID=A0A378I487_9GAMM|nr:cell division protein FtsQ/DivIB [Legionella beliardensis]STX29998.1 cell division protein FtsQ [Legionella beliardensis]
MSAHKGQLRYASLLTFLVLCALCLAARLIYLFIADAERFPINTVKIAAAYNHISHKQLESILEEFGDASFFSLSVNRLHAAFSSLAWIKHVQIERVWPDTLKIKLIEKKPIAIWNNAMLTDEGEIFDGGTELVDPLLPQLKGPANQYQQVLQVFKKMSKILNNYDLYATALEWRENGAWDLTLSNGIQLRLGKRDLEMRINRFCKAYPAVFAGVLSDKPEQMASVDLRYPRGMAVQWKK